MRRAFQRVSHRARWARRLALIALPVAVVGVLAHRFGGLDTPTMLLSFALAVLIALAALGLALSALPSILGEGYLGSRDAVTAIVVGGVVLGPVAVAAYLFFTKPILADVTTRPTAPPAFDLALADRPAGANQLDYTAEDAALQRAAYPEVRPLFANIPPGDVFFVAEALVANRGWRIVDLVPPVPGFEGRIEAVATTLVFGFRDDVVILVTGTAEGTRVDMRSASRYGESDLGANAARIDRFLDDLKTQLQALSQAIIEAPAEPAEGN